MKARSQRRDTRALVALRKQAEAYDAKEAADQRAAEPQTQETPMTDDTEAAREAADFADQLNTDAAITAVATLVNLCRQAGMRDDRLAAALMAQAIVLIEGCGDSKAQVDQLIAWARNRRLLDRAQPVGEA